MALPTKGRVIIDTTAGEIDIELWSKVRSHVSSCVTVRSETFTQETPRACRNFLALAMEGAHSVASMKSFHPN